MPRIPQKVIRIPASQPVEVGAFVSVIDHPLFQKLRGRRQLGLNHLVFPGAVHTRFEHAVGVLGLTQRVCRIQQLEERDARELCLFALLHDLGHGPFSHQIEPVLRTSHHEQSLRVLERLSRPVKECGVDPETLRSLIAGEDPRHVWVTDRNLGTDKLDYLQRDALHIGFSGAPDIEQILLYTSNVDGDLAVEEKFMEEIKRLQKFYTYLHQHGYLNKTALSAQRMFQRAVEEELACDELPTEVMCDMTDQDLMRWLHNGRSAIADTLIKRLESRSLLRSSVVIKPTGYGFVERTADKPVRTVEWSRAKLQAFCDEMSDPATLRDFENRVAREAGLSPGEALFAAMPYFDKLLPRDVLVFRRGGHPFHLFEKDRYHWNSLLGDYLGTFAIRLIVPHEKRAHTLRRAPSILGCLEGVVKDWVRRSRGAIAPRKGELFE